MIARFSVNPLSLLMVVLLAFAIGCGDEPGATTDNTRQGPPPDMEAGTQLLFYGYDDCQNPEDKTCVRPTTVSQSVALNVQVINADGDPIQHAEIEFTLERIRGAEDVQLNATRAYTDADGVAGVSLSVGNDPNDATGSLEVHAEATDDDDIDDLTFQVPISSKDAASYIIDFIIDDQSESTPDYVHPMLFDSNISCSEALETFHQNYAWPPAIASLPTTQVYPSGSVDPIGHPNVSNGDKFTVIGTAIQQVGSQEVWVAHGCADGDDAPAVEQGIDVRVEVHLEDFVPYIGERYDVSHDFNLTGALPPTVQTIIDVISTLSDSPGQFILGCPDGVSGCPTGGTVGLLDLMLNFLPDSIADTIDDLRNNGVALGAALDFLDDFIDDFLPDWATDSLDVAGDITDMLEEFSINGRMFFDKQPALGYEDGRPVGRYYEGDTQQTWDTLVFQWSLGCDDAADFDECANVPVSANDLGSTSNTIEGTFGATVYGSSSIAIDRHSMTLHYGQLLIAAIEQVALPRIFGDDVDSIDALFGELIDCGELAGSIADEDGSLAGAIEDICEDLQDEATDALYDYVEDSLVADGDDHFKIGTAEGTHCSIYQPSNYPSSWPDLGDPLPYIEMLGDADNDNRCEWNTEINYSGGADPDIEITGYFDGIIAN